MEKQCSKCKIKQAVDNFTKNKSSKDGLHSHCKTCKRSYQLKTQTEYNRQYYVKHKERILVQYKEYREVNAAAINEQRKIWRKENKEHIRKKNQEYLHIKKEKIKQKRILDMDFRLCEILRSKIHKMLSGKDTSYKTLIGCEMDTLKSWLEFQFDAEMSWSNLGTYWQIDHILPISRFNLSEDSNKRVCFSWTNLQPLRKDINCRKSNKFELHYYFNSIVSLHRFIQHMNGPSSGYQSIRESLCWLRNNSDMVKIPMDKRLAKQAL
jgi:hypothetical protein